MSGAEVIGIISGIIAIVDATAKVYNAANDALGLPEAFRDIVTRLPLVRKTLQTVSRNLNNTNPDEEYCKAIKPVLERCENRATQLDKIFKSVVPQADASRMERYVHAVRTLGKGDTVETLMKGILEDVQLLTSNRVTELPTETSVAAVIREAIEEVSAIPTSLPQGIHLSATCETERDSLLKDLRWTDPTIDKLRIERTKGPLYEDSSRWILSHPNYQKWRDGETKLLWIKGGAGKGKTMLLATIIKQLQSRTKPDHTATSSSLSFFFCQSTDDRLNNAVAILKGLIYLLLIQDVSLVLYLKADYDRMGKEIFDVTKNVNAFDVLSNVFRQMIQHSRSETVYLAVDALDECEDGLPDLLGLIRDTVLQQNRLKWIVTSRNGVDIDEGPALENPGAKLSLEVNSEAVSQAIKAYIEHKVDQLPSLRSDPTQRDNVQQKLLEKAEGTFLWVDLILRSIHSVLADDAARHIDEIPSGLPPLYDRMMGDIAKSRDGYRDACLTVLSIATLAYRPLHILELRTLAGLVYDTADLEKIVDMCGSFLTLVENHVYPIHQSAKDYLVSHAAVDKIFSSGKHAVQLSIVKRSLAAMENALRRDVYQLVHPGTLIHDMKARPPASDPLLGVGYSCAYWIDHVCEADKAELQGSRRYRLIKTFRQHAAGSKSIRIRELIKTFFHRHFLHWLEALSLLGDMANGVLSLTRLRTIVETRVDGFINLIEDAYRFILLNRSIIEQAPLQTYVSALLFTPANSTIRRLFAGEEPSWVLTKPVVEQNWSPCLQTFEGHSGSVWSVVFSPDGSRIVSASDDRTIRIWEAKSGKEVRKLEGYSGSVESIVFSPDGSRIALASGDQTIRIWEAKSGKEVWKLEGHSGWVRSVAFSPDGSRIASASDDRTIRIWEAKSGKEVRKLEGHSGSVESIVFSPDGSRIVSASDDWTIRIWEAKSGKEVWKLEGHSGWVRSVAFSPDGSRIASASDDRTIRIWEAKSGKEVRKLEGHSGSVESIVFSPDGSRIVSASDDWTIRIWEAKSGKEVWKLEGHSGWVRSVAFSPDGSRIASASDDRTIRIWEAKSGKEVRKLEGHSGWVWSVVFSPDGSRIASASEDQTIRIWEAKSGKEVRKLEGHSSWVWSVVFSPDGSRIVSASDDRTIRTWEAKSGKEVRKLEGHSSWVWSVVFSPDGSRIASVSNDQTIRIWEAKSGKEVQKLEGYSGSVWSVVFSPDSSRIVSASDDRTIRIWEAKSGKEVRKLEGHSGSVKSIVFSLDGSRIVSASNDRTIRIWEAKSGKEVRKLEGHNGWVWSVVFSPDGSRIASASEDQTIRIWEAKSGKEVRKLEGHSRTVRSVAFSPDGSRIASASEDRTIRIWEAASGSCLKAINVGTSVTHISFNGTSRRLITNAGYIKIATATESPIQPDDSRWHGYGLGQDGSWIICNGRKVLSLPLEYRARCSAIQGRMISIGCDSGRGFTIGFLRDV